ncbi:MAG: hypothetical protein P0Y56_16280 [Candidatus Andeanibacterium colombiense]|uniref:Uncharacterized protein n=1 Tax=Candidatus Andeanibacterium colombiense TaxID=3121345 RepID=A0AAJ5X5W1_9SPHN|nr:MAG: hypothetical protein P0Y56_16280 [Sphingomonadaceae bacterium]
MPFPTRILPQDPELDRLLALASTPQVPANLAARIVGDVTRLPQQAAAPRPTERSVAAGRQQSRQRLRAAGFAAVVLITGTAVALLTRGGTDDEPIGVQVAATDRPAPALAGAPRLATAPGALAPAGSPATAPGPRRPHAPGLPAADQPGQATEPSPAASTPLPAPPAAQLAVEAPTAVGEHEKPAGLAQNGPVDPGSSVGPLGPPQSTYGPPAGFGISGSGGLPMPEGSSPPSSSAPRGGRPGGPPGGPFHR